MKKVTMLILTLGLSMSASVMADSSVGCSFGNLTTANTISMGKGAFGINAGIADYTSVNGTFTYGLSKYTDGRLKIGLVDPGGNNDDLYLSFGADFKYNFMTINNTNNNPFDMAFSGFFEYLDIENFSAMQLGGKLIGSYPFALKNGKTLTPYGAFNVRMEKLSYDGNQIIPSSSDSNIEFGFNFGVSWQVSSSFTLLGEFQLDGNDGLFFGADFGVM